MGVRIYECELPYPIITLSINEWWSKVPSNVNQDAITREYEHVPYTIKKKEKKNFPGLVIDIGRL